MIEIISAESRIARSCDHPEQVAIARDLFRNDLEDGDIECSAAEVVDSDCLRFTVPTNPIGESGGSRLVDDAHRVQSGQTR